MKGIVRIEDLRKDDGILLVDWNSHTDRPIRPEYVRRTYRQYYRIYFGSYINGYDGWNLGYSGAVLHRITFADGTAVTCSTTGDGADMTVVEAAEFIMNDEYFVELEDDDVTI